jgi:hypothetical protein
MRQAGLEVYSITYDPLDSVRRFAETYGITYHLLSDEGSVVIKRFGILNTLIPEDEMSFHPATGQPYHGVPFPGTYIVDSRGVVTEKYFNRHYATRVSAGTILDKALGRVLVNQQAPHSQQEGERVRVSAFLADEELRLETVSTLYVRFELAAGLHAYGLPLPEGFIATAVEVGPARGLRIGAPVFPATVPREFPKLRVTLPVYEGVLDVAVPVTATSELLNWGRPRERESIVVPIRAQYQVCSDTVCFRPETVDLALEIPLAELVS